MDNFSTVALSEDIANCQSVEALKNELLPQIQSLKMQWKEEIRQIIDQVGKSQEEFGKMCRVSRVTVDNWRKGAIPKSKETFFRIGMVAKYDVEKMNAMLMRYGRYSGLYSKTPEACVCLFILHSKEYTDKNFDAVEKYEYILERIRSSITQSGYDEDANITTSRFDEKLAKISDEDELEKFVTDNIAEFAGAYRKLYAQIKAYFDNFELTTVTEWAASQQWSSSLRQCMSAIVNENWCPTRDKIISIGIHLPLCLEELNELLELAHMEPLCSKNIFEGIIIFILKQAEQEQILDDEDGMNDPDELCYYAREVLSEFDLPEITAFLHELPERKNE